MLQTLINGKHFEKTMSQQESNYVLFTKLPGIIFALKSSQFSVNMTVSNQLKCPDIVILQRKCLYAGCVAVNKLNKNLGVFLFSV